MKKIFSSILIIVILFNTGGYFLFYTVMQGIAKEEMEKEIKKGLDDKYLTLIIVSPDKMGDIHWTKSGKEFRYQGLMYDVVRTETKGMNKHYYCINDAKEKRLFDHLCKSQSKTKEAEKKLKSIPYNLYCQHYYSLITTFLSGSHEFYPLNFFYKSNILEISSPPPKS